MLDTEINNAKVEEGKAALGDRRLKSIGKGDLNWMGKGFLAVIKKDCEKPIRSENPKNGFKK